MGRALRLAPDDKMQHADITGKPVEPDNYMLFKVFFPGTGVCIVAAVKLRPSGHMYIHT